MSDLRVLLVDDEVIKGTTKPHGNYMWYYSQAMRDEGFQVTEAEGVDDSLEMLESGADQYDLIVLDVMMDPGKAFADEDTEEGLRTGVLLATRICAMWPRIPIIVLTNRRDHKTIMSLRRLENVRQILLKGDFPPFAFIEKVREISEE